MAHTRPEAGCDEIEFQAPCAVGEGAEVALEDYSRTVTRARVAEVLRARDSTSIRGVHLCGLAGALTAPHRRDVEDFARSLVPGTGGGLGWS